MVGFPNNHWFSYEKWSALGVWNGGKTHHFKETPQPEFMGFWGDSLAFGHHLRWLLGGKGRDKLPISICGAKKSVGGCLGDLFLVMGGLSWPIRVPWIFRRCVKWAPLKFNIAPKNKQSEKGNSSSNHHFSGSMLNFGGVYWLINRDPYNGFL